jgi:hypothetical protein
MSAPITTEPVEICGGPLDGTRLSVVTGKGYFRVGKAVAFDPELTFDDHRTGAIWTPGGNEVDTYYRTERTTSAGRVVFMRETEMEALA